MRSIEEVSSKSKISIQIKDVRAIKEATINLDSISVLCGENGCGKTTISKLLYGLIHTSINYDELVEERYAIQFIELREFLIQIIQVMIKNNITFEKMTNIRDSYSFIRQHIDNIEMLHTFIETELLAKLSDNTSNLKVDSAEFLRLANIYKARYSNKEKDFSTLSSLLTDLNNRILDIINKIQGQKEKRTKSFYDLQYLNYFSEPVKDWDFNVFEYGVPLIDKSENYVTDQKSFTNIIYIGHPTLFDTENDNSSETFFVFDKLTKKRNNKILPQPISSLFNEILNGDVDYSDDTFSKIFTYTASDGSKIPLSQAADGIKCFAILEMLFKNGYLTSETMLIIDEPEVHLHPKWIVDYARIIIQINKLLNCSVLLSSHSPDMISALCHISKKEQVGTSFYLADKVSDKNFGKYVFKNLGTDIEPIFESFNIALDRINLYGDME